MRIVEIPISDIEAPPWNSNVMDNAAKDRLHVSIKRFGFQVPLIVGKSQTIATRPSAVHSG